MPLQGPGHAACPAYGEEIGDGRHQYGDGPSADIAAQVGYQVVFPQVRSASGPSAAIAAAR